ncbi:hypothetical protein M5689_012958 [Euphorbia peplus]|nr:hypothetical protein M5689_012958 [Euphorbia peplus]
MSNSSRRSSHSTTSRRSPRICDCGFMAPVAQSCTERNSGMRFFGYKNYRNGGCQYFYWIDPELSTHYKNLMNEMLAKII